MDHISSSPVRQHARRHAAYSSGGLHASAPISTDRRWQLLDLVRRCRSPLGLRDRDITVLRGLLSFVPASGEPSRRIVFASNRVLMERCDGMDERTLRRRIVHLQAKGLLVRKQSPNGKRYQVRDAEAEARLTYGIDLTPLFEIEGHLSALAERQTKEALRIKALRAQIRHELFQQAGVVTELHDLARLALRRVLDGDQLQEILQNLRQFQEIEISAVASNTAALTASDSQIVRHIQKSYKEAYDSEDSAEIEETETHETVVSDLCMTDSDLSVEECLTLASSAADLAVNRPRSWRDVIGLAACLAPAIGLTPHLVKTAEQTLGTHGAALAVLGLVQAFGRVRNPQAYLTSLIHKAKLQGLNVMRMFKSLVGPRRTGYAMS